ncbi:hypothetical protein F511_20915 [Dorcoceras hygrometricum]|uniref:Uncharacterized protein n=1 Tax=Dorcoceras hygrometricum TaxID=472368 RepID=A0A2Z7AZG7_9LAMI|nr:hypothetical protein F511_20915 [Dorcoceras hygrometricum]
MGSFSGLGIGLSFVFGFMLVGLVAELYYLLCWKKRVANNGNREIEEFSFLFCWKRLSSFNSSSSSLELADSVRIQQEQEQDLELGSNKELGSKNYGKEGVESELMRVHNLCGPPRFLFTIKEENKEDLESEDGKSKGEKTSRKGSRTRSLSDLVYIDGTPFLTPLSSPTVKNPTSLGSYSNHGFNPLFESLTEAELNRLRSSPPPNFKFLKDAEDKFIKRLLMEEAWRNETK